MVEGRGSQQTGLKEVIQRVLQVRHKLLRKFQREENNLFKNQLNSFQCDNRPKAQGAVGEALLQ